MRRAEVTLCSAPARHRPESPQHRGKAVAKPSEESNVHEHPNQPAWEPARFNAPKLHHGAEATDGGYAPEVPVAEGVRRLVLQSPKDGVGGVNTSLNGHLGHSGKVVH